MIPDCYGLFDYYDGYCCYECPLSWQCEDYTEYLDEDYC